jgi:2-polyprenyl-3-methyl-5-hydroxy-6-metoxy-1,4-benzoquinol methylase
MRSRFISLLNNPKNKTILLLKKLRLAFAHDPYLIKESYVTSNPDMSWWENHLNHILIQELQPMISGLVADFGCNHGACSILMARQGNRVIGLDINTEALKVANILKKKETIEVQRKIDFIGTRLTDIPLPDKSLDGGFMIDVLEHIYAKDRSSIFKEIQRVLRKKAKLFIVTPLNHAYDDGYHHVAFFNEESLRSILCDDGFTIIKIEIDRRKDLHTPQGHNRINALVQIS